MMKAPEIKLLKLKCDKPLSNFAFKINLRRYSVAAGSLAQVLLPACGRAAPGAGGVWACQTLLATPLDII